jgi:hypothetical protein
MENWREALEQECRDGDDEVEAARSQLRVDIEQNRVWKAGIRAYLQGKATLENVEQVAGKRARAAVARRKGLTPRERASLVLDYVEHFCDAVVGAAHTQAHLTGDTRLAAKARALPYG